MQDVVAVRPSRAPVDPIVKVVVLTAVLAVVTVGGLVLQHVGPLALVASPVVDVRWWVILLLFVAAEASDVRLTIAGQRESVSLAEVPLVLGLLGTDGDELVAARLLAGVLVFAAVRRQPPVKIAFNTALLGAGTTVALVVFAAVAGTAPTAGGRAWLSALLAVDAAGALDAVALALLRTWFAEPGDRPRGVLGVETLRQGLLAVAVPPLVGAGGVVAALTAGTGGAMFPLAVVGVALWAGYRSFAGLVSRHTALERLYTLSEELAHSTQDVDDVAGALLRRAADILECEVAQLVLGNDSGARRRWSLPVPGASGHAGGAVVVEQLTGPDEGADPEGAEAKDGLDDVGPLVAVRWLRSDDGTGGDLLARLGVREALAVPLRVDDGVEGHLLVGYRPGPRRRFGAEDGRLLEMVANHGTLALRTSRLFTRLHAEASTDELTGLSNRKAFRRLLDATAEAVVASAVAPGQRAGGAAGCAVMVLDFDGFKAVNDTLGHHAGDVLLRVIAARLVEAAGDDGIVARLGGDEFAVIAPTCGTTSDARALAERLLSVFDQPVDVGPSRLRVGGSIGVALGPRDGDSGSELLRNADIAMYAAKRGAGASYRIYTPDLDDGSTELLTLSGDLRDALLRDEVALVLQPIVEIASGRVHSVEALARWTHPELGPVGPEKFFAAAERSGQVTALSSRILDGALALCHQWQAAGTPVRVAVNLAPRWLADPSLPEQIARALARHGVDPSLLCLEITEGSVIADAPRAIATLERLRALGVHLAVDDFGTGYSSLTYLTRLPVDQLKIDKSFVQRLHEGDRDRVLVRSILDLSRNLGIEAVAEGVTDEATQQALLDMGCRLAQGYLYSRPVAPDDVLLLVESQGAVDVPVAVGAGRTAPPAQRTARHQRGLPYADGRERAADQSIDRRAGHRADH